MNTWSETLVEREPQLKPLHCAYEEAIRCVRDTYSFDYEQADYIVGLLLQRHRFDMHQALPGLVQFHNETAVLYEFYRLYETADAMPDEEVWYYLD